MPLDHYVTLGRSGLRVSPFALGAMTFGEDPGGAGCGVEESEKILETYLDQGGNFIDTANFYTNGHSESILGDFFAARPGRRERVVLASKFFTNLFPGDPNGGGAGRRSIIAQLDESLRRLRTDHLDLYWLHNWDRHTPIEETLRALDDLVTIGKIRYIGFSNTPAWVTAQAQTTALLKGWSPLIALQVEYSLLARTVEGELAPLALDQGMALVPWSPLKNGFLSGKYRRDAQVTDSARTAFVGGPGEDEYLVIDAVAAVMRRTRHHLGGGVAGLASGPRGHRRTHSGRPAPRPPGEQPHRPGGDTHTRTAPTAGRGVGAGPGLPGTDARRPAVDAAVRGNHRRRSHLHRVSAARPERRPLLSHHAPAPDQGTVRSVGRGHRAMGRDPDRPGGPAANGSPPEDNRTTDG